MGDAIGDDGLERAADIARQRVAHLDRGAESLGPLRQHRGEVLAGMLPAGEEQRDGAPLARRHDARGKDALAFGARRRSRLGSGRVRSVLPHLRQDLHAGVVVVDDVPLRGLPDQLLERGLDHSGRLLGDLPLRGGRQRDTEALLQSLQAVKRQPAAVLEQRDHARRAGIVLLAPDPVGGRRREHLQAQVAAQLLQLIHGRGQRRLAHHPQQHPRRGGRIELAVAAFRAALTVLQ